MYKIHVDQAAVYIIPHW